MVALSSSYSTALHVTQMIHELIIAGIPVPSEIKDEALEW